MLHFLGTISFEIEISNSLLSVLFSGIHFGRSINVMCTAHNMIHLMFCHGLSELNKIHCDAIWNGKPIFCLLQSCRVLGVSWLFVLTLWAFVLFFYLPINLNPASSSFNALPTNVHVFILFCSRQATHFDNLRCSYLIKIE